MKYKYLLGISFLFLIVWLIWYKTGGGWGNQEYGIWKVNQNYSPEIRSECASRGLPPAYFQALVFLESSGERPAKTRFESHVYEQLISVKTGSRERYGRLTSKNMQVLSDETIRKLATSWGPLQIMGYHCVPLGINFEELQGEEAIRLSIQWAEKSYGEYLRREDFQNAFHIHNTGQAIPESGKILTYDPNYIEKGLALMKKFESQ